MDPADHQLAESRASQVVLMVKNPPAMQETQETWVGSLHQESFLEKGMAAQSSIPACEVPWTEEPGGLWFLGSQRIGHN